MCGGEESQPSKGVGTLPGEGSCKEWWALDGPEVAAGTMGTSRLLHGGAGDLQLGSAMEPLFGAANTTSP